MNARRRLLPCLALILLLSVVGLGSAIAAPGAQVPSVDAAALLRLIGGLLLVVLVIVGLSWSLRRFGGFTSVGAGQLKALASLPVGGRERIVLVQVGKQQLLVGVAPGRVQTLHVLEEPLTTEPRPGAARGGSFAERLRRAVQQQDEQR